MAALTPDSDESGINVTMKKPTVYGVHAATPTYTFAALFMVASSLALPVGALLWLMF